ncbi:type II toxin-antitoxin system Phd/YefM family antitoxin [Pacificibacter marinus]|uniref:type II toxin-antitoxin system Phd/YefM family antitoxin n=1 Tax=Pacificibacter marinus TaxID=658057 RepID=UPI001C06DB1A|nr:type II toxin-antitoxin system Phd/YefM family antitoxin [Pacificibacter marinus]MBU2868312.1 type II toxin-antitoxin system Phd/YefM family antitoxin [Pacificibacter marinus]
MEYITVKTTDFRPRLTELLDKVETGQAQVIVKRYGQARAALISFDDLFRIWEAISDELDGPADPKTGRRVGQDHPEVKVELAQEQADREAYRALGLDERWNSFWSWVRSLHERR